MPEPLKVLMVSFTFSNALMMISIIVVVVVAVAAVVMYNPKEIFAVLKGVCAVSVISKRHRTVYMVLYRIHFSNNACLLL